MFEEPIRIAGQPIEQGRDRPRVATVREGFCGGELNMGRRMAQEWSERRAGLGVGGASERAGRQCDEFGVGASESFAQGGPRGFRFQSRERPDGVLAGNPRWGSRQRSSKRRDRRCAEADEFLSGAIAHGLASVSQSLRQLGGRKVRPGGLQPPRIFNARGGGKADSIDAPGRRAVADAAGRTVMDVPTAGIHDEQ